MFNLIAIHWLSFVVRFKWNNGGCLKKIVKEELGVYRSNAICIYLLHVLRLVFSRSMKFFFFFFCWFFYLFFLNRLFALNICSIDVWNGFKYRCYYRSRWFFSQFGISFLILSEAWQSGEPRIMSSLKQKEQLRSVWRL